MKAAIIAHSLTIGGDGNKTLWSMELHGKREDQTSQKRRVRDVDPLVYGGLDLVDLYKNHVEGCEKNKGLKRPAMHAIIQFPVEMGKTEKQRTSMLRHAVKFINQTHGGDAVFAARMDQDEEGMSNVDVFYTPKFEKTTKTRRKADPTETKTWISTTKHTKELCEKHREEITRRSKRKFKTAPRQVGMALQAELYEYLEHHGLKLEPRKLKDDHLPDRVEPEIYKMRKDAAKLLEDAKIEKAAADKLKRDAEIALAAAEEMRDHQAKIVDAAANEAAKNAADIAVKAVIGVFEGKVERSPTGALMLEDAASFKPFWNTIGPVIDKLVSWWEVFKPQVEQLKPEDRPDPYDDGPSM